MTRYAQRAFVSLLAVVTLLGAVPAMADDAAVPTEPSTTSDGTAAVDASADGGEAVPDEELPIVRPIVFPVVGVTSYSAGFGDCRDGCTRLHEGIDILTYGWKGVPVVAAHDGMVTRLRIDGELAGCSLTLESEDGWSTRYLHLNTDYPGTDLPGSLCFAPGIEVGVHVPAGTLLGWVGDTGNAEGTTPHLHFEIRDDEGTAIDPWESREAATHITFHWIGQRDTIDLMTTAFRSPQPTLYVVDSSDFAALTADAVEPVAFDVPVIAYDGLDPGPATEAIRMLAPSRIVVITSDTIPPYLDDLRPLAPIVETAALVTADVVDEGGATDTARPLTPTPDVTAGDSTSSEVEAIDADVPEPVILSHEAVPQTFVIFITVRGTSDGGIAPTTDEAIGPLVPIVVHGRATPIDTGLVVPDLPGPEANPDGLWWLTSDGWRFTTDVEDAPDAGVAYVPGGVLDAPTLSFLLSLAQAPRTPLWNNQPTSRTSKSL
jgi:murein DD-endopeptidase MepM/ murein hydrolase activator NlpD